MGVGFRCGTLSASPVTRFQYYAHRLLLSTSSSESAHVRISPPQACGVNEGQGARGARNPHALAPGEGQAVGLHAIAEQHEGFGGDDEAEVFAFIQDPLGVLDGQ